MIGKVEIISLSNRVHLATAEMLREYPMADLRYYAKGLGIKNTRMAKEHLVAAMVQRGATICGYVGN